MAKFANVLDPVTQDFEKSTIAYMVDGFCISMGALMGVSPVTAYMSVWLSLSGRTHIATVNPALALPMG
jgi:AGZA family xanthine/uracil permease-like MFS transporter